MSEAGYRYGFWFVWFGQSRWGEDFEFVSLWISLEIVGSALQKMLALATGVPD